MERLNQALPTEQQFVELVRSYLETVLKTNDLVEEDRVYREVVLNLRANNDFISVIKLNPPYNLMVDLEKVPSGRQEATDLELLEPLADSILQYWDFTVVKEEFGSLDKLFAPAYNIEYAY